MMEIKEKAEVELDLPMAEMVVVQVVLTRLIPRAVGLVVEVDLAHTFIQAVQS